MVTPARGKGMNMAILDAIELASGLCERYGTATDAVQSSSNLDSVPVTSIGYTSAILLPKSFIE
jgi:hypothetical protein